MGCLPLSLCALPHWPLLEPSILPSLTAHIPSASLASLFMLQVGWVGSASTGPTGGKV